MEKLRFKTRQENPTSWNQEGYMDYLFGLPIDKYGHKTWYPELTDGKSDWSAFSGATTTTDPHPYEGKSLCIGELHTDEQKELVQKKLFALGHKWARSGKVVKNIKKDHKYITCYPKVGICYNSEPVKNDYSLTFDEFWHGDVPVEKPEKEDAYIDYHPISLSWRVFKNIGKNIQCLITDELLSAYKYNIMSKEEYQMKYPLEEKLKFSGHDIEIFDYQIKVGCKHIAKSRLKTFLNICDEIDKENLDILEAWMFIRDNKDKLGL